MPFCSGSLLSLRAGNYTARVAPSAGGRLASLDWTDNERKVALLVPWDEKPFEPDAWPKAGAFPMIPFANRLPPDGIFFDGKQVSPLHGPNGFAQHGLAHRREWQLRESGEDFALLQLEHRTDSNWPWNFTATQSFRLSAQGLLLTISVLNNSPETMPLSIGWHPYHPIESNVAAESLKLKASFRHELDLEGRALETTASPTFQMSAGETAAFSGWNGSVLLSSGGDGNIVISCESTTQLVLHAMPEAGYLCVEPVSLLPGHLSQGLHKSGITPTSNASLQSGASMSLTWHCAWQAPSQC